VQATAKSPIKEYARIPCLFIVQATANLPSRNMPGYSVFMLLINYYNQSKQVFCSQNGMYINLQAHRNVPMAYWPATTGHIAI
jgi:hypothetical protein